MVADTMIVRTRGSGFPLQTACSDLALAGAQPETIFHSTLPVGTSLLVVFIPSKDRAGKPVDQDFWGDEVLKTLGPVMGS
jgi:hypothetical protein